MYDGECHISTYHAIGCDFLTMRDNEKTIILFMQCVYIQVYIFKGEVRLFQIPYYISPL